MWRAPLRWASAPAYSGRVLPASWVQTVALRRWIPSSPLMTAADISPASSIPMGVEQHEQRGDPLGQRHGLVDSSPQAGRRATVDETRRGGIQVVEGRLGSGRKHLRRHSGVGRALGVRDTTRGSSTSECFRVPEEIIGHIFKALDASRRRSPVQPLGTGRSDLTGAQPDEASAP